jgi:transposase
VRPFVQTNQHDQAGPRVRLCRPEGKQAIAEAVQRAQMRFVPIKSAAQLDLPALHRARDRLVTRRTGLIDRIRAFLRERGIALQPGRLARARAWPEMLGAAAELSPPMGALLARLRVHGPALDDEIAALDQHSPIIARTHPGARLLMTIPGIGALIAPARSAASDGGQAFGRGRDRACWLGWVPRQHATGGKARRRGIAQRGNGYRRRLLVHAARSLKRGAKTRDDRRGARRRGREARAPPTGATVARAAKLARGSGAVLARNQP